MAVARYISRFGPLLLSLLALACVGWNGSVRADEPAKELTDEDRGQLEKQAVEWDRQGVLLHRYGKYAAATDLLEKSLEMRRRLYPVGKFPDGRLELATSLNHLGDLLDDQGDPGRAEALYREALAMFRRLYSVEKYPDGHPYVAGSLNNLGFLLQTRGQYGKAEPFYREALAIRRKLYPADKYPDGHPKLATSLNNLSDLLRQRGEYGRAEPLCRDALDMTKRLYPADKYPNGHPDLAGSLNNLAVLLDARGEYGKAEPLYRDALEMYRKLYPAERYPDGHPELAAGLNNLGDLLRERGEYGKADILYRESLKMHRKLYPADKYPDGHPRLAGSLNNLAVLLDVRGEYGEAEPLYREALDMRKRLYPADKYPNGHPDLANSLNNLGGLLKARREYGRAEPLFREALEMRKKLYPADKYPGGHPDLALSINNLGVLLELQGEYGKAEPLFRDVLDMTKRLYPTDKYPDGHPHLAGSFNSLGSLLLERGDYGKAAGVLAEGASMYDRLAAAFADGGAEAETLNLAASLPRVRNLFLAATAHVEGAKPAEQYPVLWPSKSALARGLQRRRRLLRVAADADDATRRKVQTLIGVRQDLARLVLASARPGDADRVQLVQDLTDKKERLEKELAALLPASDRRILPYTDLADHLPDHAAFVDLYRYADWDSKTRKWDDGHYAVFLLRKGQPIRRVELGDAGSIENDLTQWRQDIAKGFTSDAAGRLRANLWQPIAKALGADVQTVYLCPDGALHALPWAALPGEQAGHVLLENYAFAVVPNGPFLLEQLSHPLRPLRDAGQLLAVGGVAYDRAAAPADKAGKPWPPLPATVKERAAVVDQAGKLTPAAAVVELAGPTADVSRVLTELPRARWAHLATHGFFAAKGSQEREHLFRPDDLLFGAQGTERRGAAERNPLTLSGLVLAGANQPSDADPGVLTGEALAGLDLDGMDLAVLSACQTALGESSAGEGVFGLQRAFHIGGARNVAASLWKVDDEATAALMNLFYYHLWEKNEPPLEALHHAQLELYRNPQGVPALARGRGAVDWDETVRTVTKAPVDAKEPPKRAGAVKDWAAFVLSGAGR